MTSTPRPRPLAIAALVIALCAAVSAWDWRRRVDAWLSIIHGYNRGLVGSVGRALESAADPDLDPERARAILERVVANRTPGLRFAALVHQGRTIARTSLAPDDLALVPPERERIEDGTLTLWMSPRDFRAPPVPVYGLAAPNHPPPPRPEELNPTPARTHFDDGPPRIEGTLVFGYSTAFEGERARKELADVGTRLAFLLLASGALVLAYRAGRRAQAHAEELALEKVRTRDLAEIGLTAAGLAHETKNPLGIVTGLAQQLAGDASARPEDRARAEKIIDAADRAVARLGDFIHYARLREPRIAPLDLAALVRSTLEMLADDAAASGVTLRSEVEVATVRADKDMVEQILVNLVLNSVQASPRDTRVTVRATRTSDSAARLEVIDEGAGIAPELIPRIFQPYVTGRADGHGLGLAIVKRLVDLHGWTIQFDSELQKGTRVRIDGLALADEVR